jgi:hypothetical protein
MRKCAGSPPGSGGWHKEVDTGDTSKTDGDGMWVWPCQAGGRGGAVRAMSSWRGGRWRKAVPGRADVPGGRHVKVHAQREGIQNKTGMRSQLATCIVCPAY